MIAFDEAFQLLIREIPDSRVIQVPLEASQGKALAVPVRADLDLPPFKKSLMDGYALRSADVLSPPVELRIVDVAAAGRPSQARLSPGEAIRIMTGAPLPQGADAVQPVERTESAGDSVVRILETVEPGDNIAPQGSEVRKGDVVLEQGRKVGAGEIGVLATFGRTRVEVYEPPRAGIVSTGDEVVEIDQVPEFGQIRNSNTYMLRAQCRDLGVEAEILARAPDDPEKIRAVLRLGLKKDLLILSGGVSMGEYDFIPRILAEEGVKTIFYKTAIRPGKPVLAGRREACLVFGLPGNPVSSFVTFELLVRPAIRKWMGFSGHSLARVQAELMEPVTQKPGRRFYKPACTVRSEGALKVRPIETKGSADLVGFSRANSLLIIEADVTSVDAGSRVDVLLLKELNES